MKKISLRDYYPFYKADFFIDVNNEVAELLEQFKREEHAAYERRRVHKAYYSLDAGDGIEREAVLLVLPPGEIYERRLDNQRLYAAVSALPEKQAKRVYAHFFHGMSKAEIARIERVSKTAVSHSIEQALKSMKRALKKM